MRLSTEKSENKPQIKKKGPKNKKSQKTTPEKNHNNEKAEIQKKLKKSSKNDRKIIQKSIKNRSKNDQKPQKFRCRVIAEKKNPKRGGLGPKNQFSLWSASKTKSIMHR